MPVFRLASCSFRRSLQRSAWHGQHWCLALLHAGPAELLPLKRVSHMYLGMMGSRRRAWQMQKMMAEMPSKTVWRRRPLLSVQPLA